MRQGLPVRTKRLLHAHDLLFLERVMNLGENRIGMRIPRSAWFLRDLRFSHSYAVSNRVHNTLYSVMQWYWTSERSPALCRLAGCCGSLLVLTERRCSRAGPTALTTAIDAQPRGLRCLKTPESMSKNAPSSLPLSSSNSSQNLDSVTRSAGSMGGTSSATNRLKRSARMDDTLIPLTITGRLTLKAYSLSVVYSSRLESPEPVTRDESKSAKPFGNPRSVIEDDDAAQGRLPFFVLWAFYFGRRLPGRRLPPSSATPPISPGTGDR